MSSELGLSNEPRCRHAAGGEKGGGGVAGDGGLDGGPCGDGEGATVMMGTVAISRTLEQLKTGSLFESSHCPMKLLRPTRSCLTAFRSGRLTTCSTST